MALDLSAYTNVSNPLRRGQTFNLGNLFIDQEGIYSRDADGQRGDLERTMDSYYMGGAPGSGQQLMRLDDLPPEAAQHYLNTGKTFDLNGMKFITQADAMPVWQALGGGADGVNQFIGDYAVPALMAAVGAAGAGGLGSTGEFAGAGTFGGGEGLLTAGTGDASLIGNSGGDMLGTDMTGFTNPDPMAFGGGQNPLGTLPDTTRWLNPTQLTGEAGGLPTANAGQFGSVVNLANSAQNLPVASGVTGGYTPGVLEGILSGGKSILGNLVPGNGNGQGLNLGNVLSGLGQAGLGYLGADKMADAYQNIYNQQSAIGAPYRDRLNASYQPGFTMMNDPGYADALDNSTNTFLRAASAGRAPGVSGGNPIDNPGAWAETMKYVNSNLALPALQTYRGQLGQFGGMGLNTAGQASLMNAQAQGGGLNAIGYGLNTAFQQPSPLDDYYRAATRRLNSGTGLA